MLFVVEHQHCKFIPQNDETRCRKIPNLKYLNLSVLNDWKIHKFGLDFRQGLRICSRPYHPGNAYVPTDPHMKIVLVASAVRHCVDGILFSTDTLCTKRLKLRKPVRPLPHTSSGYGA